MALGAWSGIGGLATALGPLLAAPTPKASPGEWTFCPNVPESDALGDAVRFFPGDDGSIEGYLDVLLLFRVGSG
jgi:hypothetical protein